MVENNRKSMIEPSTIVAAFETAGFTHLVWIPDSHLGTWEPVLEKSRLAPIRVTREGEAVGLAAGLILGGARPLVAMQCTGFFEAGDAVRNVAHDLKLPLKLIVGVRSRTAQLLGKSSDNCPRFAEKLIQAWDIPHTLLDPNDSNPEQLAVVLRGLVGHPGPAAILWAE
jgi:sulfopyruvate decarboxylase TPP-binding subunit